MNNTSRCVRCSILVKVTALLRPKPTRRSSPTAAAASFPPHPGHVGNSPVVVHRVFANGQLLADVPAIIRIASETDAAAVRNGERGSLRNTFVCDVLTQPIETESRYDDTAHAVLVVVEWHRKVKDVKTARSADCEFSDCEFFRFQDAVEVRTSSRGRRLMLSGRVAYGIGIHVDYDKDDKLRESLIDPGKVSVASLNVLRLYRKRSPEL